MGTGAQTQPVCAHRKRWLAHQNHLRRARSLLLHHGWVGDDGSRGHPEVRFDSLMLQSIRCACTILSGCYETVECKVGR